MKKLSKSSLGQILLLTVGTIIIAIGAYFFKFQNNFSFGGVTGISVVLSKISPYSPSTVNFIVNILLLIVGFFLLGKQFGLKTVYSSMLLSGLLSLFEKIYPMHQPLTDQPFLEFVIAVFLAALGAAILFNIDASGGGTDIIAVIIKKYTGLTVGSSLFIIDLVVIVVTFFVFDIQTGLFAVAGLVSKTFVINGAIESLNLSKYFNIICSNPKPIVDYINKELGRGATISSAKGAFSNSDKYIIFTALYPEQAVKLRNKVKEIEPSAFVLIMNSSEIIGRGFQD